MRARENRPNAVSLLHARLPELTAGRSRDGDDSLLPKGWSEETSLSNQAATDKPLQTYTSAYSNLSVAMISFRQILGSNLSRRNEAIQKLDHIATRITSDLANMPTEDKVRLIGSFGTLVEYNVQNRIPARYNTKPLLYQNTTFYSSLVDSIDWTSLYSTTALSRTRTLSPLLSIVRAVNRMGLPREKMHAILLPLISDVTCNPPRDPKPVHIVELVSICAKNKLIHPDLFKYVSDQLSIDFASFHEDLVGDLLRAFTNLNFFNEEFLVTLERELPVQIHELAWWNLVDLGDYYATTVPINSSENSQDMISRISNEVWKWIPDMRSGYAAKALRVLSQLDAGDERTRRSLIRAIPKSLDKMHANVAAATIVAAAKVKYNPKTKYGKRHGSVFYRRVAARLVGESTNSSSSPLAKVSARLIVDVVQALANVGRPLPELFDSILFDMNRNRSKYTLDQQVRIERLLNDMFGYNLNISATVGHDDKISDSSRAYLARSNPSMLPLVFNSDVNSDDIVGLLRSSSQSDEIVKFAVSKWLDNNISGMTMGDFFKFISTLAVVVMERPIESDVVAILAMKANSGSNLDYSLTRTVECVASLLVLSEYDFGIIGDCLWQQISNKPVLDHRTIKLCQLICGHIRVSERNGTVNDSMHKFCCWIESHLVTRGPREILDDVEEDVIPWVSPPGWVSDLSVFPVIIPLAVPSPGIDLRKLHAAKGSTAVKRILHTHGDAGVAVFRKPRNQDIVGLIRESYLKKLGWTVRHVGRDVEMTNIESVRELLKTEQAPKDNLNVVSIVS